MPNLPEFPFFKPLELADREVLHPRLWAYQPEISELTFTNLFVWRGYYGLTWSKADEWLIFVSETDKGTWALPPVGPEPRAVISGRLLDWLAKEKQALSPGIHRADRRLAEEVGCEPRFAVAPDRPQFDYVYRSEDLINLTGRKYHDKRNHINSFRRSYRFVYEPLGETHLAHCFELAEKWCDLKRCEEDLNLMGEWEAVREALRNFHALNLKGGVILINGKVEAFTLGELLNQETAVIHIEKADPDIKGLYAAINQQFCEHAWPEVPFINREQDLGEPGLRAAKESYNPHHLVEKFSIRLS
ncbi:MAG: phosphatidylglycerol lysyltransferase domain-containing protein [Deltaproteobacteria bacterium]|nr:phosphatidylglycerol lysyltransferase domain-containing protein [Deltaproteobacteria bacterium]